MAGYMNRFVHRGFPDLAGYDENLAAEYERQGMTAEQAKERAAYCWVKLRNPRLIPADELMSAVGDVRTDDHGNVIVSDSNRDSTYAMAARLVIAGQVWDPTSLDDDAPLLPVPPAPEHVKLYPMDVFNAIAEELKKATPQ